MPENFTLPVVPKAQPVTFKTGGKPYAEQRKINRMKYELARPSGLKTLDEGEPLYRESEVKRERLGYEKREQTLKQKIKEAGEQFLRFAFIKGQTWYGLLQSENQEQDKFKEWYLGRHTAKGQARNLNVEWDEVWIEQRSVYTFLEMAKISDELLGLSKL